MPRRGGGNSNLWTWVVIAIAAIIVFALLKKFIEDNPWVRWVIWAVFTGLFVFCVLYFVQGIRSRIFNIQWLCSIIGAVFSILLVNAQTDFFKIWWPGGAWLVWVFYGLIVAWLLYLIILLIRDWWQG